MPIDSDTMKNMTLRDYFAAKAMQSLILIGTSQPKLDEKHGINFPNEPYYFGVQTEDVVCTLSIDAYKIADQMLEARKMPSFIEVG